MTVGLEVHAELATKTKMFCACKNDPDETEPNVNICPVCTGQPGTLPVPNKEAIRQVIRFGLAVNGKIADFTEFDRKNYFYPDIPKGYQISQYKYPIVTGGSLLGVGLTRIHLEEDTGTSIHDKGNHSLVDYNRAGVPLMELVTEPVITNARQAGDFARELQLLLRYLGAGEANMEKGEMRIEANISVSKSNKKGTKVEVKNLNSFKSVERAIQYEFDRQIDLLESGEKIIQETRGWDEDKQKTFSQRTKETSEDYRYFPEPDIPKFKLSEIEDFNIERLVNFLPELPWKKREIYKKMYGLKDDDVEFFVSNILWANYFENVVELFDDQKLFKIVSNYITSDLVGLSKGLSVEDAVQKIIPENLAGLMKMVSSEQISSRGAKDILKIMYEKGGNPEEIAKSEGLIQKSDERELSEIIEKIIAENQKVVDEYKSGKEASLQFLIGQAMKATKGSANPQVLKKLFETKLK